jgi:hypothetical protein
MVDYDLVDPEILDALRRIKSVSVKTTIECGFDPWTKDGTLVDATSTKRRLLLTANYRDINERRYKPCLHGGILLIHHPKPSWETVYERMKAFSESGGRSQAKGHVTYLKAEKAIVHKLFKEVVEVPF